MPVHGFFSQTDLAGLQRDQTPLAARCGACGLYKGCRSPKMPPTGQGRRKVLIVAEAPGADEDEQGVQLIGKAGQLLRRTLAKYGIDLDRDCWKTNALICRPPNNATPTEEQIGHCLPNLTAAIREYEPEVIIPLGIAAVKAVLTGLWRDDTGPMQRWAGQQIPLRALNTWVCPTYHPSYLLRQEDNEVLRLWWGRHLAAAFDLDGRPWPSPPGDYGDQVELVWEPDQAARIIDQMIAKGGCVAFDYETNMLKPDGDDAYIASCSVCWRGRRTIAFPWVGSAREAVSRLLRSDLGKIASNMKFEERWSRRDLGHGVRNWVLDTMQLAHVLDSQKMVTSIKFQAFVRLGQPVYDQHIKPYLESKGPRIPNRIKAIDPRDLLRYNGLDSLLEYLVAKQQNAEIGLGYDL